MIEMLGVLVIVDVLSVAGISGYSKAMMKYRLNRMTEEYIEVINNMLTYQKDFTKEQKRRGTRYFFAPHLKAAGLIPDKWRVQGSVIYDSMGNHFTPFIAETHKRMCFDLALKTKNDLKGNTEICQMLMINVVQYYRDVIYGAGLYRGDGNAWGGWFLGTTTCKKENSLCLSDVTISEIHNICNNCLQDSGCALSINFIL